MIFYKKKTVIKKILNSLRSCFVSFNDKTSGLNFFNFFKGLAVFFVVSTCLLYSLYLFFLPNFLDEKKAEDIISSYLAKHTKLTLDIDNLKVSPNYKFDINLKADYIKLKYSKENDFFVLEKPNIDINLLTLFLGYVDLNKIKGEKLIVNTNFLKTKRYSAFNYFDLSVLKNKSEFELRNIKLLADEFYFNLYDENINQKFVTKINKFEFFDISNQISKDKIFKIIGDGAVSSNKFKISDLNINLILKTSPNSIYAFVDKLSKLNYNPFQYAYEYKFYSKANVCMQINNLSEKPNISGEINLFNYTFKIKDIDLPKNNAKLVFKGNRIFADLDFNFIKNQYAKIKAEADFSKNKYIEAKITSTKIDLSDFKDVVDVLTKIFNVPFNSSEIELSGFAAADLYLRSNFKTLISKGNLKIKNAKIYNKKLKFTLDDINSDVNFDNNKINIINTTAFVDNSKFYLTGTIDEKTNLDLKANSDLINISQVLKLIQDLPVISSFVPELSDYIFKSGLLKINTSLKGNLKNPIIATNSVLKDFRIYIKSFKSEFASPEILISANPDKTGIKEILFKVKNSNLKGDKWTLKIPETNLKIKDKDIVLLKTPVDLEGIKLNAEGFVKDYRTNLKETLLTLEGSIPHNNDFITVKANNSSDISFKSKINFKNNNIVINLFNLIQNNKEILSLTGEIKNILKPELNNLKIVVPDKILISSKAFDNLSFEIKGDAFLAGKPENLNINSNLKIYNFSYKPLNLYLDDIVLNSRNSMFYINSTKSRIGDFAFDFVANAYYKNKKMFVDFVQINSNYIDLSKLQSEFKKIDLNSFEIKTIKGNIQTVVFGGIDVNSLKFEGSYKDYILSVKNFSSLAYDGEIQGSGVFNFKTNKLNSDLVVKEVALRKLLSEINEIKKLSIAASGRLSALVKSEINIPTKTVFDMDDLIRNTEAYIKFNIDNGELAQFAKLERFLQAGNILSQSILKLSVNSIASVLTKQNTGDFKTIEGTVKISASKADIQYIKTIGSNMSMYIEGKLNLLSQYAELNILGRIPVSIVHVMGNFGKFTTQKLVDKMSNDSKGVVETITASPIEKMFSTYVSKEEIEKIPQLSIPQTSTREFRVNIFGPISDTKSIHDFKWIIQN